MSKPVPTVMEVQPEPSKKRAVTRSTRKKSAPVEFVPEKPALKKLKAMSKGSGRVLRVDDNDVVIISPEICGRRMVKSDSLFSSAEVAMGVL